MTSGPDEVTDHRASIAQERRYRIESAGVGRRMRGMGSAFLVSGDLSPDALAAALDHLVERHDNLRSSFALDGETVVQRVHRSVPGVAVAVETVPAGTSPGDWARSRIDRPLDRGRPPLLRAHLGRTADGVQVLALAFDHLLVDGASIRLLLDELGAAYEAIRAGRRPELAPVPLQFPEWAARQREELSGERLDTLVESWRARLGEDPDVIGLRLRGALPDGPTFRGRTLRTTYGEERTTRVRAASARHRTSAYVVVLACLARVLADEGGGEELTVTTTFGNRTGAAEEGVVGRLAHPMLLRLRLDGARTMDRLIPRVRAGVLTALDDSQLPFDLLRRELWPDSYLNVRRLPTVLFDLGPDWDGSLHLAGCRVEALRWDPEDCSPGLELFVTDHGSHLAVALVHETSCYPGDYAEALLRRLGESIDALAGTNNDRRTAQA